MGNQSPSYKECSFDSLQRTYISPTIYIDVGDLLLNFDIFVEHTLICKISGWRMNLEELENCIVWS